MANHRKHQLVGVTDRETAISTLSFWVSGSGNNMTGSIIAGTELACVLSFPSGTYQADNGVSLTLPSGSFIIQYPVNSTYPVVDSWFLSMEASASSYNGASGGGGGAGGQSNYSGISQFEVQEYYHSPASGTFIGGFVQPLLTGSAGVQVHTGYQIGAVPYDKSNPAQPACTVNFLAVVKNTTVKP